MKYGESDSSEYEPSGSAAANRSVPSLATPAFGALTLAGDEPGALPAFHERTVLESSEAAGTDAGDVWKWGEPVSPGGAAEETLIAASLNRNSVTEATEADDSSGAQLSEVSLTAEEKMPKGAAMSLEEMKEVEPWPMSPAEPRTYRGDAIGEALERVAKRIRDGEIVLPADTSASNDEAALALALAALLRTRPG
jgi:hypothetical protein